MTREAGAAERQRVLVVDRAPRDGAQDLVAMLERQGCAVRLATGDQVSDHAGGGPYLLAILRPRPGAGHTGADLRRLKAEIPFLRVAIIGRAGAVADAVEAIRGHAFEYLEAPVTPAALGSLLRRARHTLDPQTAALLDSLQRLTPGLVHELHNPLSSVLAGSQLLARLLAGQGKAAEYADIVREEAQRLQRFLARLAEFGRLESCRPPFPERVELGALVERVLEGVRAVCDARRIGLASICEPGTPAPLGDAERLGLAVGELVQNAVEAVADGGRLTVHVRRAGGAEADGAWVEVAVADSGPGMTEDVRQHTCEPFFSTRPGALGIGLALAQAVARAHGGILRIGGAGVQGGYAAVCLPLAPSPADGLRTAGANPTRQLR